MSCLSIYLFIHLSIYPSICLSVHPASYLPILSQVHSTIIPSYPRSTAQLSNPVPGPQHNYPILSQVHSTIMLKCNFCDFSTKFSYGLKRHKEGRHKEEMATRVKESIDSLD